eukprot:SAG11_NODE_2841_length_2917_cov_2.825701_5_plen_83_part_00
MRGRPAQAKKQQAKAKAETKKIRLSPRTDAGSLLVKARQIAGMLAKGQRVNVFIFVKSREDRLQQHTVSGHASVAVGKQATH